MRISDWSSDVCSSDLAAFHCDNLPVQEIEIKDRSGLVPCNDDRRAYVVSRAEIDVLPNGGSRECLERRWQQVHGLRDEFVGDTAPTRPGNDPESKPRLTITPVYIYKNPTKEQKGSTTRREKR